MDKFSTFFTFFVTILRIFIMTFVIKMAEGSYKKSSPILGNVQQKASSQQIGIFAEELPADEAWTDA